VASLARKMADVSRLQLLFLSATWMAGIYMNGFVPMIPGTSLKVILLNPAVESHVVLATLSAATSVFILALSWAGGSSRSTVSAFLATVSIVLAGGSGLAFILGGTSDAAQSMIMACSFITALFLTFVSMASMEPGRGGAEYLGVNGGRAPLRWCYVALVLFYAVFVSGIYVNLNVAGPDFSLPIGLEPAAFKAAESSTAFVVHEALGGSLLASLVALAASLWFGGARRDTLVGAGAALLVSYSAYVGSLNLTSIPVPEVAGSPLVPMLSSAGLMAAIILTMLLTLRIRGGRSAPATGRARLSPPARPGPYELREAVREDNQPRGSCQVGSVEERGKVPLHLLYRDVDGEVAARDQLVVSPLNVDERELVPAHHEEHQH
jgi:hypothetical protein